MRIIFKGKQKGQIFLIIGIFVLFVLILLKTETSQTSKYAFYAGAGWENSVENIKSEYKKTTDISLAQEKTAQNLERNINNFSNFSIDSFGQRGHVLQVFYSFVFVNETNITAVVGNSLGGAVMNISLNLSTGQSTFIPSMPDRQTSSGVFLPASSFNASVSYYLNETLKNLTYSADNNITAAFYFSVYFQQADSFVDDVLIFNKTLS